MTPSASAENMGSCGRERLVESVGSSRDAVCELKVETKVSAP